MTWRITRWSLSRRWTRTRDLAVVEELAEEQVEVRVEPRQAGSVVGQRAVLLLPEVRAQPQRLGRPQASREGADHEGLEGDADVEEVDDLVERRLAHRDADLGRDGDEALEVQPGEGRADGRLAHPESLGEQALRVEAARRERAALDELLELLVGPVLEEGARLQDHRSATFRPARL
jgi:hypothetical protein